jgi:2-isopropylmalate synthase
MNPRDDLIYNWNERGGDHKQARQPIELLDETMRDGLQSASVIDPPVERKIEILHLMDRLGLSSANIGLPGAGPRTVEQVEALAREIRDARLAIRPNCAARTVIRDIEPIVDISQRVGIPIEACTFIGSSPIRQYAEDWTLDTMLRHTEEAVGFVRRQGLECMFVTEDTTRAHPDTLAKMFRVAIRAGASRICLCDTVGHITPRGVGALVRFTRDLIDAEGAQVKIDWHGHNDRGLGAINAVVAIGTGAHRVHGTALGIGERVGNAPLDQILVNLKLWGWIDQDLSALGEYCRTVAEAVGFTIPMNYPVVGADAFRTGTGVHAAAIIKAIRKGDAWLTDAVYSGVPAHLFGLEQVIEVGPMSGESNVIYWLESRGFEPRREVIERILARAKASDHTLSDDEVRAIAAGTQTVARRPPGAAGMP